MAKVRLKGKKYINTVVSHEKSTKDAVHDKATMIGALAEARLDMAKHRTGDAQIKVKQGRVDSYVILDDPAAMQIEFGHWLVAWGHETDRYIPGLYVLHGAAGLV